MGGKNCQKPADALAVEMLVGNQETL